MGSTSDKISEKVDDVAGKARQACGKAMDNHEQQKKGRYRQPRASQ